MATMTLNLSDGQTWIYPALSYTGYDGVKKTKNHWYKGHSVMSRRGKYCYQGGLSDSDGHYNGNMLSIFLFKDSSGRTLKNAIKAIGGSSKITKITLKMYVSSGYGGYFTPRICFTPYWDTSSLTGKSADSYDGLGFKHILTTGSLKKSAWHNIDLTNYKSNLDTYESLAFYLPGAYNAKNSSYGAIHAQLESNPPQLIIEYNTNSAPNAPTVSITSTKDSHGYISSDLKFTVRSNGDPDNNLHSSPYNYQLYNQNGALIKEGGWTSSNSFSYNLENYRGQTVKVRGIIRDTEGLTAYSDTNVYINTRPYWKNISANAQRITFTSGLTSGVFLNEVTMTWPQATDDQSQHSGNLRYSVYAQVGSDKGASGDTSANCVASNLTGTSLTINAANMSKVPVPRGERVYFSVWVTDGLENSSYRITSAWISRELPPVRPGDITAYGNHFESSISISWAPASSPSGLPFYYYIQLRRTSNDEFIRSYDSAENSFTCNDLHLIPRGAGFYFKIWTIDVNGTGSEATSSGTYWRNDSPTNPRNFRVNANTLFFKDNIPLIWSPSHDSDGDTVRYDVYYSANNSSYRPLVKGTLATGAIHDVSSFQAGTKFNYYVEAYDPFDVYSGRTYIKEMPQKSVPPEAPSIVLPYNNKTLYSNAPRIVFRTDKIYNTSSAKVIITVNGVTYDSNVNPELFNKSSYGANEEGMFSIPEDAPLNYSKRNSITIKVNDGVEDSTPKEYNYEVAYPLVNKISENEQRFIIADDCKKIRTMIDTNRNAYGMNDSKWKDEIIKGNTILKKHFDEMYSNVYEIRSMLNSKFNIREGRSLISKKIPNDIIDIILKP